MFSQSISFGGVKPNKSRARAGRKAWTKSGHHSPSKSKKVEPLDVAVGGGAMTGRTAPKTLVANPPADAAIPSGLPVATEPATPTTETPVPMIVAAFDKASSVFVSAGKTSGIRQDPAHSTLPPVSSVKYMAIVFEKIVMAAFIARGTPQGAV